MSGTEEMIFRRLIDRIEHLERVVRAQGLRLNNMIREASVVDVDYGKALAIVDAHGIPSKPIPWLQHAGDIVDWDPPKVGQRVTMFSPGGDMGRGFIMPGGYTNDVPQPYQQGNMFGRTIGDTKISGTASGYSVETPTFSIKANVVVEGDFRVRGGVFMHNDKNVGSTHAHESAPPGSPGPPI